MKNLENIPKREIFTVPEGYFETLPGKIQARISSQIPLARPSYFFRLKLQYVIPMLLLVVLGFYHYVISPTATDAESILATVDTEALVGYLNDTDMPAEDLLENLDVTGEHVEALENEVYHLNFDAEALEDELGPIDLDNI